MTGDVQCVVLDCPDAGALARFYRSLLGGEVDRPDPRWAVGDDFSTLHTDSGLVLAFQRVDDHRAPRWPDARYPQQFHLDLDVPDLDEAQEQALGSGATLLHADARGWRILADPAGHPFCLLRSRPPVAPTLGDLFRRHPRQFGLRGDVRVWERMGERLAGQPIPGFPLSLRGIVERAYAEIVEAELPGRPGVDDAVPVPRLRTGSGMSDGQVSPHFWRHTAIPLLIDRAAAI